MLELYLCKIKNVSEMQFGPMSGTVMIGAVFILIRLQEECCAKGNSFIDMKTF